MSEKPRILVLGGAGMIGRNFVKFCVDNDLAAYIRVADKTRPEIAYFSQSHKDTFADERVTFVQADLTRDAHVERAFNPEFGPYDYVYNLAGESKYGLGEAVYASKCRDLSVKCATKAQKLGVKRYIEVSTAFVYKSQAKTPASETAELQPWTLQAKFKLEAEEEIRKLSNLDVVFVRPATVYGSADIMGLMPRIVCAAAYVKLKEKMKLLWDAEMRVNTVRTLKSCAHLDDHIKTTEAIQAQHSNVVGGGNICCVQVHVYDVSQALWHLSTAGESGHVYNLVDKNDTNQEKINAILEEIFQIRTGFIGKLISNLARMRLADVVDDANEKHMQPWADLCQLHDINNTPLTPYIDKELLQHNHLYANGSKIEATGFTYKFPTLETAEVRAVVEEMIAQKMFPPILT